MPRNYELYDPLDFLAEVTQHIPNKGEHQVRYYGFYSNKRRGINLKNMQKSAPVPGDSEPDTPYRRKCLMTWAALIKAVFEVDPLKCSSCGGTMKIVGFIDEENLIEKILWHCKLWKDAPPRPPPVKRVGTKVLVTYSQLRSYAFYVNSRGPHDGLDDEHGGYRTTAGKFGARKSWMGTALFDSTHRAALADGAFTKSDRRRIMLWLDCNSDQYGAYLHTDKQRTGEIVWPSIDMDSTNPTGVERLDAVKVYPSRSTVRHKASPTSPHIRHIGAGKYAVVIARSERYALSFHENWTK